MLIGDAKDASKIRLNLHGFEIVSCYLVAPDLRWVFAGVQTRRNEDIGCESFEGAVSITQVEIVGIRGCLIFIASSLDGEEALRPRHIQRPKNEDIQYAKHHGVGADGEGQRQDGGYGESGRTAELAERQTHVGPDRLEGRPLPHFAAALLNHSLIAEGDARLPLGLLRA